MSDITLRNIQSKELAKQYLDVQLNNLLTPPESGSFSTDELTQCTAGCLHELLSDGFLGHRNMGKMISCLQILIDNNANVNERVNTGKTPIYFAVTNNFPLCAEKLLAAGADLTSAQPDNRGFNHSLAATLAITMPHVLLKALDNCVTLCRARPEPDIISLDWRQIIQYKKCEVLKDECETNGDDVRIIVNDYEPGANQVETSFLYGLLEETHEIRKTLFTHPLLSAYIDSKYQLWKWWMRIHYMFAAAFSLTYMSYVYCLYFHACEYKNTPYNETFYDENDLNYGKYTGYPCDITMYYRLMAYFLFVVAVLYTIIEIGILAKFHRKHIKLWQTWITIPNLILMFLTLWPALWKSYIQ